MNNSKDRFEYQTLKAKMNKTQKPKWTFKNKTDYVVIYCLCQAR